jgi:large subunit ribosomal protein L17
MRHRKKFNHLGRKAGHRKAMLANMASSLILHKRISTTTAKAKALRSYVEPLITKTKDLTTEAENSNAQRVVFSYLKNRYAVKELFREVGPKVVSRPGGYTRILKTGTRLGDNADMCVIELVDYNENLLAAKEDKSKSTRRSRRGAKKVSSSKTEVTKQVTDADAKHETKETKTEVESNVEEAKVQDVNEVKEEPTIDETVETPEIDEKEVKAEEEKPKDGSGKNENSEEKKD